jgi:hypothetical protein
MVSLLFWRGVDQGSRKVAVLSIGLFVMVESILVFREIPALRFVLVAVGALLVLWPLVSLRFKLRMLAHRFGIDQAFLLSAVVMSWVIVKYRLGLRVSQPDLAGLTGAQYTSGVAIKTLSISMLSLLMTRCIAAVSDLNLQGSVRPPDRYPMIAFTKRRLLLGLAHTGVFWIVGILILPAITDWVSQTIFMAFWFFWAVMYSEWIHGYRSIIIYVFGGCCFLLSAIALGISADPRFNALVNSNRSLILPAMLTVLFGGFFAAARMVFSHPKEEAILVPAQRVSHFGMVTAMFAGVLWIFLQFIMFATGGAG